MKAVSFVYRDVASAFRQTRWRSGKSVNGGHQRGRPEELIRLSGPIRRWWRHCKRRRSGRADEKYARRPGEAKPPGNDTTRYTDAEGGCQASTSAGGMMTMIIIARTSDRAIAPRRLTRNNSEQRPGHSPRRLTREDFLEVAEAAEKSGVREFWPEDSAGGVRR